MQVSRIGFEPFTREVRLDAAQGETRTEDFTLLVAHSVVTASEGYVAETSAAESDAVYAGSGGGDVGRGSAL